MEIHAFVSSLKSRIMRILSIGERMLIGLHYHVHVSFLMAHPLVSGMFFLFVEGAR